ncbi:MAG: hypothetical protein ACRDN0_22875 [Trebonia sp.]
MAHTDERHATLAEVACDRCGAVVDVAKFSPQHTSVQWNADSVRTCAEWSTTTRGCAYLRESIDRAVRDGRLEVKAP